MNRTQITAAVATALVALAIVVLLLCTYLAWNPAQPWPPLPEPYIELAQEEFVEVEELPLPRMSAESLDAAAQLPENSNAPAEAAPESGAAVYDRGEVAKPAREVAAKKESTVKTVKTPKPDKAAAAAENKAKEKEATARRTNSNVSNAFAKSTARNNANNANADQAKAGRSDGNPESAGPADSKATTAGVRHGNLTGGWLWPKYAVNLPTSRTGSIILALVIDRTGTVTAAEVVGGEQPARDDSNLRAKCIQIARSKKFIRSADAGEAPERATARLTFTFK